MLGPTMEVNTIMFAQAFGELWISHELPILEGQTFSMSF
jgi:hypothetical protein